MRIEWTPAVLRFIMNGEVVREEPTDDSRWSKFREGNVAPMEIRLTLWAGFSGEWVGGCVGAWVDGWGWCGLGVGVQLFFQGAKSHLTQPGCTACPAA